MSARAPVRWPADGAGRACPSIVLTGAECTGKTTLARALAARLDVPLVEEQARAWLDARGNRYGEADLVELARAQDAAERRARREAAARGRFAVVADTDLTVIRVWGEVRFGRSDPRVRARLACRPPALYLLPRPDLPWEADPQRENPDDREALHLRYRALLATLHHPWREIDGLGPARLEHAWAVVTRFGVGGDGS